MRLGFPTEAVEGCFPSLYPHYFLITATRFCNPMILALSSGSYVSDDLNAKHGWWLQVLDFGLAKDGSEFSTLAL
jgi:hypothetical protein